MIVCLYVDDILIMGPDKNKVEGVKKYLAEKFNKIKDLKTVEKYLGLKVQREGKQVILSQADYVEDIIMEFSKIRTIRPRNTPIQKDLNSLVDATGENQNSILDILGKIRYLADRTRHDLSFAASFLARFAIEPKKEHVDAIYQTLGYLLKTKDMNLRIGSSYGEIKLFGMSDASYIRSGDSKSQLAYCLLISRDSGAFVAKSQKDKSVSISSFHAEVNALIECVKSILYYRDFLEEINFKQMEPTVIYVDNESVIGIATSIAKDNKSIYLTNKINFIREQINDKKIVLEYINTHENVADLGTKSLDIDSHNRLACKVQGGITQELFEANSDNDVH